MGIILFILGIIILVLFWNAVVMVMFSLLTIVAIVWAVEWVQTTSTTNFVYLCVVWSLIVIIGFMVKNR